MRTVLLFAIAAISMGASPDPVEIVRKSIELDQNDWMRMKDYTWIARETTRRLNASGRVRSTEDEAWETTILFGEPYRKIFERNGKPVSAEEQRREQKKIDQLTAKIGRETPERREKRLAEYTKEREKDREFLREIPDAFDFKLEGSQKIDGRDTWVIAATPKRGYRAKHSDAKAFSKIEGRIWIDQSEFQWVRVEAKTLETIAAGLFLARLNPGATLVFEQTRINDEIWLPSREVLSGSGRIALLKKLSEQQEITWTRYRKFQVDSKIIPTR